MLQLITKRSAYFFISTVVLSGCASQKVDPVVDVTPYQAQIERLDQVVKEQQLQVEQLTASVEAMQLALEAPNKKEPKQPPKQSKRKKKKSKANAKVRQETTVAKSPHPLMQLYFRGSQHIKAKQYDEGIAVLQRFLKLDPTHVYADRVQYLIVEAHAMRGEHALVIQETKDFEAMYPYSFMLPAIMYRRGVSYQNIGQTSYATAHFDQLVKRFPSSRYAELSAEHLNLTNSSQ